MCSYYDRITSVKFTLKETVAVQVSTHNICDVCVLQLLTVAVLAIVVTAPIGAVAISVTGPLLLKRTVASVSAADDVEMQAR